jgi:dTDP-4-amino-4,6-dideoxygalactose transaminase
MNNPLHVGRPNIGHRERFLARVNDILDRRWLSNNGPVVQEFEKKVAEILGVNHALLRWAESRVSGASSRVSSDQL